MNPLGRLLALLLLLTFAEHANAQPSVEPLEDYTERLNGIMQAEFDNQNETFALWVGIADPDYGDLYFVFGNAKVEPDVPATLEHKFDIGSISKTMGGTVVMLLAEQGVLSLEDKVETLIPDFTATFTEYANYTVEELLRMKTIVPDFLNDPKGELKHRRSHIALLL